MSTLDIRKDITEPTTRIVFAERTAERTAEHTSIAHFLVQWPRRDNAVSIEDGTNEKVIVMSKQHALDLIKALEKSIALGWLK